MAVRNLASWTLNEYTEVILSWISVKQETLGVGEVYFSSGREKSGFHRVDFDLRPNQISEKSLWNSFIIRKGIIYILKRSFNINRISGWPRSEYRVRNSYKSFLNCMVFHCEYIRSYLFINIKFNHIYIFKWVI